MNAYKATFINAESVEVLSNNMGVGVMQGLVFLTTLIAIFIYKNRSLQIKLCKLNILLIALQIAAVVMYSDVVRNAIDVEDTVIKFQFAAFIPVISLILTYLAIRLIKKDEKLVRAADRLR